MTAKKNNSTEQQLVRDYLIKHPSFLQENPDIFEAINISHNSGKAISLVERQIVVMRDRNKAMSSQVNQMVHSAKENALLMEKTNRLILDLVKADDLKTLVDTLATSLKNDFTTEFFSLCLFDNDSIPSNTQANVVSEDDAKSRIGGILLAKKAVSGVIREEEIALLFGQPADSIGSVIALPLKQKTTFGVLAFGHRDANFYSREIGTVFIDYIGDLLNELIPKHIESKS